VPLIQIKECQKTVNKKMAKAATKRIPRIRPKRYRLPLAIFAFPPKPIGNLLLFEVGIIKKE
jgi:hypothetical protein